MSSIPEQLDRSRGFNEIFLLVKRAVYRTLGRRRAGLMLGLSDLPPFIVAYYTPPNIIVLNRKVLSRLKDESESEKFFKSYVFQVLLHEYLHSLGYDEGYTDVFCYMICKENLGMEHPATMMVRYGISAVIPSLKNLSKGLNKPLKVKPRNIEFVKGFDSENVTYLA